MSIPKWKKLEQDVQTLFTERSETEPMIYHRFYDTASATGFLPAQPGDHLVIYKGIPILIETKYTSRYRSLSSCFAEMVGDSQIGSHRLWLRAGAQTLFVFQGTEGYELWDGGYCVQCRINSNRLTKDNILRSSPDLDSLLEKIIIPVGRHRKLYIL